MHGSLIGKMFVSKTNVIGSNPIHVVFFYFILINVLGILEMSFVYRVKSKKLRLKKKLKFFGKRFKKYLVTCKLNRKRVDFFSGLVENSCIHNWAGIGMVNNFTMISSYIVISCMRRALNFLFFCLKRKQKIFLASNDFRARTYLNKIKCSFLFRKRLMFYTKPWVAGFFSNVNRKRRRRCIPDLVVSLTPDFDAMIVKEAFIILRPSIGLSGGKYGLNVVDFPIIVDGLFLSYAFCLVKIILDFYFLTLRKKLISRK